MPQTNVVITGLGVVSSIGIGCDAFFDALLACQSGVRSLAERTDQGARPDDKAEPAGIWVGAPIIDFDAKQYVRPRKALKVMCREIQLAFAASQLAVEHAGLADQLPAADEGDTLRPGEVGTVFGSEMFYGPPTEMEDAIRSCLRDDGTMDYSKFGSAAMKQVMPLWMLKYLPNMPACHVGIALNAHGPNNSLVLGDVSGPAATIEAAACLQRGIAKVMVAGATGTRINTTRMNYRGDLPVPDVSDPLSHSSRPYAADASGVVGGEAAGALVLETNDAAGARGAPPIARIKSYAQRFVASEAMQYAKRSIDPQLGGQRGSAAAIEKAARAAIEDAGLAVDDIGLVVSHAMGDPVIDAQERQAIGRTLPHVPLVAPIASLGHTGAASGTMEMIIGAMSVSRRVIPPTLNAESADGCFRSQQEPLSGDHVLCICHNSEGGAMAVVLAAG